MYTHKCTPTRKRCAVERACKCTTALMREKLQSTEERCMGNDAGEDSGVEEQEEERKKKTGAKMSKYISDAVRGRFLARGCRLRGKTSFDVNHERDILVVV